MEIPVAHYALFLLFALSLATPLGRNALFRRKGDDWALDASSLAVHFFAIPALQLVIAFPFYSWLIPNLKGQLDLGWGLAIALNALIDYGWYWNHRLFHARTWFWNLHAVHHAPDQLDLLMSPRNSVWSPLFMVYFWFIPLFLYLAANPIPFLGAAGFSLIVNFWGHTALDFPPGSLPQRILNQFLIQPKDHHWHHSAENPHCNFGTVYNFWDRMHGTWQASDRAPTRLGFDLKLPTWKKIFYPVGGE